MEEDNGTGDVEMDLLKPVGRSGHKVYVAPSKLKSQRSRSTFCVAIAILVTLVVTAIAVWGLSRSYNASALKHADIENAVWLQILAAWKPIANGVIDTMDPKEDVCEKPYDWACKGFLDNATIPTGGYYVSKALTSVRVNHNRILTQVIQEEWPIVSPYYRSCNSSWSELGFDNIADLYTAIDNSTNKTQLFAILGGIRSSHGLKLANFAFRISVQTDPFNSSSNVVTFHDAENTLPSPIYYSGDGDIDLENYQRFISSMFSVTPRAINSDEANAILAYETQVATILTGVQSSSMEEEFTRRSLDNARNVLGVHFTAYVDALSILKPEHITPGVFVVPAGFFVAINQLLSRTAFSTLKNLALYSLFKETYPLLGPLYFNTNRGLSGILTGTNVHSISVHDRESYCIRTTVNNMPMLMGHYYVVAAGINTEYKNHITELVQFTREAFSARLDTNSWMDTATRVAAEQKLQQMKEQVCYPDNWDSVLEFEQILGRVLDPTDYFANTLRIYKVNDEIQFSSVLKLTSRTDWSFDFLKYIAESPEIINAFYSPSMNRITIAAGMAQPPFIYDYDWKAAPLPSTFGGLVTIIGHEITHGFDDQGAQYNSIGELQNWWSDASKRQFNIDAQCIAQSRSRVETQIPGVYLNGNLVLGESIADIGGIETALDAMELWEANKLSDEDKQLYDAALYEIFPTYDRRQLFFLFFIQNYCELQTDESVYEQVVSDPHPPGRQRVEALLADVPRFAEAFNCKKGTKYNPVDSCSLW